MRRIVLLGLSGCLPISPADYAREARPPFDAAASDQSGDAHFSGPDASADASSPPVDAESAAEDAADPDENADAGPNEYAPEAGCETRGVLCDDFETGLVCAPGPSELWSACENIGDHGTGPVIEELHGGNHALRSSVGEEATSRSQRLLRTVPVDADYFEAEFWMIAEATENEWFTWMRLQQEVGNRPDEAPFSYPGVSLISRGGNVTVGVETQQTLSVGGSTWLESEPLGPWPRDWVHVKVQIDFREPSVRVEYNDPETPWELSGFTPHQVPVQRQYFALGLYAETPGAVRLLIDGVRAHALKDGRIIPLL